MFRYGVVCNKSANGVSNYRYFDNVYIGEGCRMSLYEYYLSNVDNEAVWIEYVHGDEPCLLVNGKHLVRVTYAKKVSVDKFLGGIL